MTTMHNTIISTQELHNNLHTPGWIILDCRFELQNPSWGRDEYLRSHIPGAVFADLNKDLSGSITPETGRHPLPNPDDFTNNLARWGIKPESQVVVYDSNSGGFASRAWWLLRIYGHQHVAVMDGGWQKWIAEALPISSGNESGQRAERYYHLPDSSTYVDSSHVLNILGNASHCIIDVRSEERYRGEVEPIDPVAGHIPGAINRPTSLNLTQNGVFKSPGALRSEITSLLGDISPQNAVIYCGSGVTSCHLALAMELAELPGVKIYTGSWSEWIRDPKRPIE